MKRVFLDSPDTALMSLTNNFHHVNQRHFFHLRKRDDKLVLNDKNYDKNLLTFSSTNKNETNVREG